MTSSCCKDILGMIEGTDQWSCVEGIILDTSANSLHLRFCIYYISTPKKKFRPIHNRKENDIYCTVEKIMYIDTGYKLAPMKSRQVTKRY